METRSGWSQAKKLGDVVVNLSVAEGEVLPPSFKCNVLIPEEWKVLEEVKDSLGRFVRKVSIVVNRKGRMFNGVLNLIVGAHLVPDSIKTITTPACFEPKEGTKVMKWKDGKWAFLADGSVIGGFDGEEQAKGALKLYSLIIAGEVSFMVNGRV